MKMTTYKYVNVNAVVMLPNRAMLIEQRDSVTVFRLHVKGTWSRRGTCFRVCTSQQPVTVGIGHAGYLGRNPEQDTYKEALRFKLSELEGWVVKSYPDLE
jgi:hypothetical protein